MAVKLDLTKETKHVVELGLTKNNKFLVELYWKSKVDLDAHAIAITKQAGVSTINGEAKRILSVYNKGVVLLSDDLTKTLSQGAIGSSFTVPEQYMTHTGDMRASSNFAVEPDEVLEVDLSKVPDNIDEIAFIVSIHPPMSNTFEMVKDAKLIIREEDGTSLIEASLTDEFKDSNLVHLGSVTKNVNGVWGYNADTSGIIGNFNDVLSQL